MTDTCKIGPRTRQKWFVATYRGVRCECCNHGRLTGNPEVVWCGKFGGYTGSHAFCSDGEPYGNPLKTRSNLKCVCREHKGDVDE